MNEPNIYYRTIQIDKDTYNSEVGVNNAHDL